MGTAPIRLVVSDVDGTLVTTDKRLTPASIEAVHAIAAAGVLFTLISSRPPRGMAAVAEALGVSGPMAAFNGGTLFLPDQSILEAHRLGAPTARGAFICRTRSLRSLAPVAPSCDSASTALASRS